MREKKQSVAFRLLGAAFLLICVICVISSPAFAQGNGLGKFRTTLDIPSQDAPTCTKPSSGLVIKCYDGYIYTGGAKVASGSSAGTSLTATDNMTACPTTGTCNFIYANSGGTLAITTSLATAWGAGNSPLYFVQTASGSINNVQFVSRSTRPANGVAPATVFTDSGTQITTTEPFVAPASTTSLASTNVPAGTAPTTPVAGDVWNDSTQKAITISPIASNPLYVGGALTTLGAQTAITTVSIIQAMNSTTVTLPANALNVAGKTLHVRGYFVFSNGVTTPAITVTLKLGTILMAAPVSAVNANSNSSSPAWFDFYCRTVATGASGTVEAHGTLDMNVTDATNGHALSRYSDYLAAVSSAVDLTSAQNITVNMTVATGPVTTATLRLATFEIMN